jgi:hypothetical protein
MDIFHIIFGVKNTMKFQNVYVTFSKTSFLRRIHVSQQNM